MANARSARVATVDAFVACGGRPDKTGFVRKETLVKIIKGDFGLTINIEVRPPGRGSHADPSRR